MKAITLWQPWATWIARGWKTIETRQHNRFACLVGERIAIHAGQKFDKDAFRVARIWWSSDDIETLADTCEYPHGAVVATAMVDHVRYLRAADSEAALCPASGLFGLILTHASAALLPRPARGKQGIWEWTPTKEPTDG